MTSSQQQEQLLAPGASALPHSSQTIKEEFATTSNSFEATAGETLQARSRDDGLRDIEWSSGRITPKPKKKSSKSELNGKSRRGVGYYNDAFALRESGPAVPKDAPVWAELRTNVILENEFDFTKAMSSFLSRRYKQTPASNSPYEQNSEHNVTISVEHSSCMMMSGTFDGCYILTITALHSISSTVNKRNTLLVSDWLEKNLGVGPSRGVIKFAECDVANIAVGGVTVLEMMEREKFPDRAASRAGSTTPTLGHSGSKTKKSLLGRTSSRVTPMETIIDGSSTKLSTKPSGNQDVVHDLVEVSTNIQNGRLESRGESDKSAKSMKRGRSMFNLFGKSQKA